MRRDAEDHGRAEPPAGLGAPPLVRQRHAWPQPERERVEDHLAACRALPGGGRGPAGGRRRRSRAPARWPRRPTRCSSSACSPASRRASARSGRHGGGWPLLAPLPARWCGDTPRPLRGALVAQAAVIVLLVGFLAWDALRPGPPPAGSADRRRPSTAPSPTRRPAPVAGASGCTVDVLAPGHGAGDPRPPPRRPRRDHRRPVAGRRLHGRGPGRAAIRSRVVLARLRSRVPGDASPSPSPGASREPMTRPIAAAPRSLARAAPRPCGCAGGWRRRCPRGAGPRRRSGGRAGGRPTSR